MTREDLYNFAATRGYRLVGDRMLGVFQGYPFSALFKQGRTSVFSVSLVLAAAPKNKYFKALKGQLSKGIAISRMSTTTAMMTCSAREEDLGALFLEGMNALTTMLREQDAVVPEKCPLCRQTGCDAAALTAVGAISNYVPVHRSCCEARSYSAVTSAELNSMKGNYLLGFIGALLGGAVGAIPSILTIWYMDMISAWLYALIPLAAYFGYKLLGGRMDKVATVASVVSSVLQLFMVEQVIFYFSLHEYFDIWPSPISSVIYYFQIADVSDMLADMAMPALFTLLGIWIAYQQISHTNKSEVTDANTLLDSLTPFTPIRR